MIRSAAIVALALLVGATGADARGFKLKGIKKGSKATRIAARALAAATASRADSSAAAESKASAVAAVAGVAATPASDAAVTPAANAGTNAAAVAGTADVAAPAAGTTPVASRAAGAPEPLAAAAVGGSTAAGTEQHASLATTGATAVDAAQVGTPVAGAAGLEDAAPGFTPGDGQDPSLPESLRENHYFYQSFGTADPFRSLLSGDFQAKKQELVDLHTVKMVGVVWEPDEIAAMLEDAQGFGYTLRPGDTVKNGTVVSVTQETLVARLNIFGQTTQLTLRLQHEE
jgi:hypothetical protein